MTVWSFFYTIRYSSTTGGEEMVWGIIILVIGVALLLLSIPYAIMGIITGVNQLGEGVISGGLSAYLGVIGVVAGFVMTTIGAIRVFKR